MRYFLTSILMLAVITSYAKDLSETFDNSTSYKSKSGRVYEYDLSSPSDAIRYESDYNAQSRDRSERLYPDPYADIIDDAYGQSGGGRKRR